MGLRLGLEVRRRLLKGRMRRWGTKRKRKGVEVRCWGLLRVRMRVGMGVGKRVGVRKRVGDAAGPRRTVASRRRRRRSPSGVNVCARQFFGGCERRRGARVRVVARGRGWTGRRTVGRERGRRVRVRASALRRLARARTRVGEWSRSWHARRGGRTRGGGGGGGGMDLKRRRVAGGRRYARARACGRRRFGRGEEGGRQTGDDVFESGDTRFDLVVLGSAHVFVYGLDDVPLAFVLVSAARAGSARMGAIALDFATLALCSTWGMSGQGRRTVEGGSKVKGAGGGMSQGRGWAR
ncbi:hypothetical protein OF83DRAFT_1145423 [Amylostereum chailletii]|nr:hypothetical protein OF83DRAFT_1145423 [Amylostereum chailletii]